MSKGQVKKMFRGLKISCEIFTLTTLPVQIEAELIVGGPVVIEKQSSACEVLQSGVKCCGLLRLPSCDEIPFGKFELLVLVDDGGCSMVEVVDNVEEVFVTVVLRFLFEKTATDMKMDGGSLSLGDQCVGSLTDPIVRELIGDICIVRWRLVEGALGIGSKFPDKLVRVSYRKHQAFLDGIPQIAGRPRLGLP